MEDSMTYGQNAFMMGGRMTTATANAMETAAGNSAGAMTGFMGMGMAGGAMGGGFNAAQNFYHMGQQQMEKNANEPSSWRCSCGTVATGNFCPECGTKKPAEDGWGCSCGAVNKGKFCPECGKKKPSGVPQYRCDKCGWEPADPTKAPRFCPECGDPFDAGDIV